MNTTITVCILEDDNDTLDILGGILHNNHIEDFKLLTRPEDFLQSFGSEIVVCLIDLILKSGMSGLDVIKAVKAKNQSTFVIVMSGLENYKLVIDCLNAGANRYIDKNNSNYLTRFIQYIQEGLREAEKREKLFDFLEKKVKLTA